MKKNKLISTRIEEEYIKEIEQIALEESIDKSSLIRKWIISKIKEYRMQKAAEKYRKGLVSLEEAAVFAKVSLWEILDYIRENNIWPPVESDEELEEEFKLSKKFLSQR